jgi:hypothetical protein
MKPSDLPGMAASLQSLAVTLAILIGGLWALFRFRVLRELDKARIELQRLNAEIERKLSLTLSLDVQVAIVDETASECYLIVNVVFHNAGTHVEVIDWTKSELRTGRVIEFDPTPILGEWQVARAVTYAERTSSTLEPSEKRLFPFVARVNRGNVYYLEFYSKRDRAAEAAIRSEIARAGVPRSPDLHFSVSTFVAVPISMPAASRMNAK